MKAELIRNFKILMESKGFQNKENLENYINLIVENLIKNK